MSLIIYQWCKIDTDIELFGNSCTLSCMAVFIHNDKGIGFKRDISWLNDQFFLYEWICRNAWWISFILLIIIISILCWVFYNSWPNPNGPGWIDDQGRQIPWLGPNGGAEMPGPNGGAEMPGPISKQPPRPQVNTPVELPVESPVGPPVECPNFGDPGIPNNK